MSTRNSYRQELIFIANECVLSTMKLNGVLRIALIGSITTNKEDPKDIDLLVTVKDDMDLKRLAKASRRLLGKAQSLNRGGEAFLANPRNQYIGRICRWKKCGPWERSTCDALHCGLRLFLHDDFQNIMISDNIVSKPPVEVWPKYIARVEVPDDITKAFSDILS